MCYNNSLMTANRETEKIPKTQITCYNYGILFLCKLKYVNIR
ncbi:MAG: hypothetical protein HW390_1386 [Candidatus Brocadiaceae bacterium]|nr:hypothetical protein [Candidatus Brocadiaceae bacterium]